MTLSKPLKLLCILDDRPGHAFQVEAVLQELAHRVRLEVDRHYVHEQSWKATNQSHDLCIGAGRKTNWPLAKMGIFHRTPTVVIMKPNLPTFLYSLCVIPQHDHPVSRPNILAVQFAPTTLTPGDPKTINPEGQVALIGGPSSHFDWEINRVIKRLRELDTGSGFEILTSRRTPDESVRALQDCGRILGPDQVDRKTYEATLRSAGKIVVTPDSVSMLGDALATSACVFSVPLKKKKSKVSDAFDEICRRTNMDSGSPNQPVNEASRIADHILQRFFL